MSDDASVLEAIIKGPAVVKFWPAAGEALGYSRPTAYAALRNGTFEVPILNRGTRHFVLRSALLKYLDIEDPLTVGRDGGAEPSSPRADPVQVVVIRVYLEEVPRVEVVED